MEYRMYYLVLRHLSGINKAVQTSHASIEYAVKYIANSDFQKYATIDKTIVMLDGGTHQEMVMLQKQLDENGVNNTYFIEPDINDAMTAICFLVDERLFNKDIFVSYEKFCALHFKDSDTTSIDYVEFLLNKQPGGELYEEWVKQIGGTQNETIYNIINGRKLSV
jgi:hypothetical protein